LTTTDLAIIGAGAAGLAAAIFAGQAAPRPPRIVLLDGAKTLGAKILVAGGGRCNVTHDRITPEDYCGGSRTIIRNVLRAFDENRTMEWMRELGVPLKVEPTGKLFPVSDQARSVLDALLHAVAGVGGQIRTETRVTALEPREGAFALTLKTQPEPLLARRVIVATGGRALPKSGSDGAGLEMMRALGHTIVPTTPALSPLVLRESPEPGGRFAELSGLTLDVRLSLWSASGKLLEERTGSMVFTHFGVSGPAALDISRHWLRERLEHPAAPPRLCLGHPALRTVEEAEQWLLRRIASHPRQVVATALMELYPERLARLLAGDGQEALAHLGRERRRELAERLARLPLDVTGDRGYTFAETTAGGVDLREVDPRTMQSRKIPGLYLCGEILDVDGRIGGFNFQWAWASGYLAGRAATASLA
jgi:predicted Rossmann fold flavoprotein